MTAPTPPAASAPCEIRCRDAAEAGRVAFTLLREAVHTATPGPALVLLPGGRSPDPMLACLRDSVAPWPDVILCPTDERLVPAGDAHRNDARLRHALADGPAAAWPLVPLADTTGTPVPVETLPWPAAVTVLGMGEDGHIASLFPGGSWTGPARTVLARAPAPPEARISLGLDSLLDSAAIILLVMGRAKQRVYEAAREAAPEGADLPVGALLARATGPGAPPLTVVLCDDG